MLKALVAKGLKGRRFRARAAAEPYRQAFEPDQAETAEVELIPNAQDIFAELKSRLKAERTERRIEHAPSDQRDFALPSARGPLHFSLY